MWITLITAGKNICSNPNESGASGVSSVTCFVRERMRKKGTRKQLSQEMEQKDFTFLCTQSVSCRFKWTPSAKQMIAFSKQPQCDRGCEQTASFFMHAWFCFQHLNPNNVDLSVEIESCLFYGCICSFSLTFKGVILFLKTSFGPSGVNNFKNYIYEDTNKAGSIKCLNSSSLQCFIHVQYVQL